MADPRKVRADANAHVGELLERLANEEVRQLEVKRGGLRVRVSRGDTGAAGATVPPSPAAFPGPSGPRIFDASAQVPTAPLPTVSAPLTGVFYRSASPQAQPYVQVGSSVGVGEVIGLIEAMKLFNEIRSTAAGTVRRILAENGQLVRAHQPLLELQP